MKIYSRPNRTAAFFSSALGIFSIFLMIHGIITGGWWATIGLTLLMPALLMLVASLYAPVASGTSGIKVGVDGRSINPAPNRSNAA